MPPLFEKPLFYYMPLEYDHSERKFGKVITLKYFLISCLELMKNESSLTMFHGMIYHCTQEKEIAIAHKTINQVHHKKIMNRELQLNA
jgi:hypothetical protein